MVMSGRLIAQLGNLLMQLDTNRNQRWLAKSVAGTFEYVDL